MVKSQQECNNKKLQIINPDKIRIDLLIKHNKYTKGDRVLLLEQVNEEIVLLHLFNKLLLWLLLTFKMENNKMGKQERKILGKMKYQPKRNTNLSFRPKLINFAQNTRTILKFNKKLLFLFIQQDKG